MQLYTVRMNRKQVVSKYNMAGKKISEETLLIPQVYQDLPHQTALAYREKFPDADVQIERQFAEARPDDHHKSSGFQRTRGNGEKSVPARKVSAPPASTVAPSAATTGDMSAALNKAMEKVA